MLVLQQESVTSKHTQLFKHYSSTRALLTTQLCYWCSHSLSKVFHTPNQPKRSLNFHLHNLIYPKASLKITEIKCTQICWSNYFSWNSAAKQDFEKDNKHITHHSESKEQELGDNAKTMLTRIFRVEKAQSLSPWDACPASQAGIISTQDARAPPDSKTPPRFVPVLVPLFKVFHMINEMCVWPMWKQHKFWKQNFRKTYKYLLQDFYYQQEIHIVPVTPL